MPVFRVWYVVSDDGWRSHWTGDPREVEAMHHGEAMRIVIEQVKSHGFAVRVTCCREVAQ